MRRLVIKLDSIIRCCILNKSQLLAAYDIDSNNITQVLEKVGDFKVDEVCVYVKPDTRQDIEGVILDRIISDTVNLEFRISQADYDTLKAIAIRTSAESLSFYSAYKHYTTIISDGVVVDTYSEHSFIVAHIIDCRYRSLDICSAERLQKTIENCRQQTIVSAYNNSIPELANIAQIPDEVLEDLSFVQWILYGSPCYVVEINTGDVFEYGDKEEKEAYYEFSPDEFKIAIIEIQKNIPKKTTTVFPKFGVRSIALLLASLVSGLFISIAGYNYLRLPDNHLLLDQTLVSQSTKLKRLEIEKTFFEDAILNGGTNDFYTHLVQLSDASENVSIASIRFNNSMIELTVLVLDESSLAEFTQNVSDNYEVTSQIFEKEVTLTGSSKATKQYNIILSY